MHLNKIEIKGFKSFANRTELLVSSGITCIVGPNGSGKSNITDAVRWVLGEQSAKLLRGSRMEDVIFAGTKSKKSLGLAEVSLTIDNSAGVIGVDYEEVHILRRLYRSGEGEYLLNGTQIRLRDLRELLADTGIGKEGYSVIGQGKIDEMISASDEERRAIFDEACGIAGYKKRKRESVRQLDAANTDLQGADIRISELDEILRPLKEKRDAAIRYAELYSSLRAYELSEYSKKFKNKESQLTDTVNQIAQQQPEKQRLENLIIESEQKTSRKRSDIERLGHEKGEMGRSSSKASADLSAAKSEDALLAERLKNAKDSLDDKLKLLEEGDDFQKDLASKISATEIGLESLKNQHLDMVAAKNRFEEERSTTGTELQEIETEIRQIQKQAVTILNDAENKKSRIKINLEHIENINSSISTDYGEDAEEQKLKALKNDQEILKQATEQTSQMQHKYLASKQDADSQLQQIEREIYSSGLEIRNCENSLEHLTKLEQELDGYERGVKNVLDAGDPKVRGVVGSIFTTKEKYETAIETSLGRNIGAIVIDRVMDAKQHIERLRRTKSGRVSFLPMEELGSRARGSYGDIRSSKGFEGFADEIIEFDPKFERVFTYLLARTVIASDYESGAGLLKFGFRVVTLDGDVLNPRGLITGGQFRARGSIISRRRKIGELQQQLDSARAKAASLEKQRQDARTIQEESTRKLDELGEKISSDKMRLLSVGYEIKKIEELISSRKKRDEKNNAELTQLLSDNERYSREIEKIYEENDQLESRNESLGIKQEDCGNDYNRLGDQLVDLKVKIAAIHEKIKAATNELEKYQKEMLGHRENKAEAGEKKDSISLEIERLQQQRQENQIRTENARKTLEKVDAQLAGIEKQIEQLQKDAREGEDTSRQARQDLERAVSQLYSLGNKKVRLETEMSSIRNELMIAHGITLEDAADQIGESIPSRDEIRKIREEIEELGEINKAAIQEYEELSARHSELCKEREDILQSIANVETVIDEISELMQTTFKKGFEQIQKNFSYSFSRLFGGGEARLAIAGGEDPLESGIEIEAQPPGKKLQNISLLSGGEKALTAIALLFAILELRPSAFCILDEIEAALDDVNIKKFTEFLKEYSKRLQFIVITHRRGTMEIADTLHGVTMEEYGVSKMLSINLEGDI